MFGILIVVILIIMYMYKDHFIAQFDMIINKSLNPIYTNYHAREKINGYGDDSIDAILKNQLMQDFSSNKMRFTV